MKKIFVFTCALLALLIASTALADAPSALVGQWEDTVSERAWMRIDQNEEGDFDVLVYWGGGIYEGSEWLMTCACDPTTGQLVYSDGGSYYLTYDGNGNVTDTEVVYDGATGIIWRDGEGCLRFLCEDSELSECRFVWSEE